MSTTTTLTLDSIETFRQYISDRGKGSATIRAYSSDLRELLRWQAERLSIPLESVSLSLEDLERACIDSLNEARQTKSAATVQRRLTTYKAWAKKNGLTNFLSEYSTPPKVRPIPHPLPEGVEGVELMCLEAQSTDEIALFALCGLVGLRISEARAVRPSHLDWQDMLLKVKGKGEKVREVYLSPRAWSHLERCFVMHKQDDSLLVQMADRTARYAVTNTCKRLGFERDVSSHDLRATFATAAYRRSMNIRAVQDLMGHAQISTTEIYTLVGPEAMRDAVDF